MSAPTNVRRKSPVPLARTIGPHAALNLVLLEDHEEPGMRIYALSEMGGRVEVGFTGEEFEALCEAWGDERQRSFVLKGIVLP